MKMRAGCVLALWSAVVVGVASVAGCNSATSNIREAAKPYPAPTPVPKFVAVDDAVPEPELGPDAHGDEELPDWLLNAESPGYNPPGYSSRPFKTYYTETRVYDRHRATTPEFNIAAYNASTRSVPDTDYRPARRSMPVIGHEPMRHGTPVYPASDCIGPVIMGICHGSILPSQAVPQRCYGTMLNGSCIGPQF